jgi:hypothetical protein
MRAGRRRRSRRLGALGVCLVAVVVGAGSSLGSSASAQLPARASAATLGSSCAHPATVTFKPGEVSNVGSGPARIAIEIQTKHPWWVAWVVRAGYIVCSARIQLRDGSWVRPTRLRPYQTPTPWGGEYKEAARSRASLRQIVIGAARSPVAAGSSCNYPLASYMTLGGPAGDTKDISVNILEPGYQGNGTGLETTLNFQLEVTIHNPRIVVCAAGMTVYPLNEEGFVRSNRYKEYPVAIPSHGGLSRVLGPVSTSGGITGQAFARY